MHRFEIKLDDNDFELLEKLVRDFGFKSKTEFFRNVIRSNDHMELLRALTHSKNNAHYADIEMQKMLYLNYKSLVYLLQHFLSSESKFKITEDGLNKANEFLEIKSKEFLRAVKR